VYACVFVYVYACFCLFHKCLWMCIYQHSHTNTHTHTHIYIYIYHSHTLTYISLSMSPAELRQFLRLVQTSERPRTLLDALVRVAKGGREPPYMEFNLRERCVCVGVCVCVVMCVCWRVNDLAPFWMPLCGWQRGGGSLLIWNLTCVRGVCVLVCVCWYVCVLVCERPRTLLDALVRVAKGGREPPYMECSLYERY